MTDRQIIVVDVETNGLDVQQHIAVEVSWLNMSTGANGTFIPPHAVSDCLATADIAALRINRYIDRIADQPQDNSLREGILLARELAGNTLAGSNPAFDECFLRKMLRWDYVDNSIITEIPEWHHRKLDLSSYAAPPLGLGGHELPGLATVCVTNHAPHTAAGDVAATAECFEILFDRLRPVAVEAMA